MEPAVTAQCPITPAALQELLAQKVRDVARQPEHAWPEGHCPFMTDEGGGPLVRLAAVACPPDFDIWQGLRSPAQVGMYPVGLADIWTHYAAANVQSTRPDGSPNPLAMPEPFEEARTRLGRAVIISAMLAMSERVYAAYAEKIARGDEDPADDYCRARREVSDLINKAVGRLALAMMVPGRAVVPMTNDNAKKVIEGTRSAYASGRYHGPCNNHYPQNSVAVLTGLLRFGLNRLPFRDEVAADGAVRRLLGQYASVVIFDERPAAQDGMGLLDAGRLARMRRVADYTDTAGEVVAQRYCTYNLTGEGGRSVCGKCIDACPSGAIAHSSPAPDGSFDERLLRQKHRFWNGTLDFDAGNCGRERNQKAQLYAEYVCARCEAICAARGVRRRPAEVAAINAAR